MKRFSPHRRPGGFTIIELMVSLSVLTLMSLGAARIYLNYTATSRDLKASNLVYQEARFLMERIVREVRQNAIDYEQYWNQNVFIPYIKGGTGNYVDYYCAYGMFFTDSGPDGAPLSYDDNDSTGLRNPELGAMIPAPSQAVAPMEEELYLINISGNERTIITRVDVDQEGSTGNPIGTVALNKMIGVDYGTDKINAADPYGTGSPDPISCPPDERENDGLIDTWICHPDFENICKTDVELSNGLCTSETGHEVINDPDDPDYSFINISPNSLNIVDLRFIISPQDDPWKAYNIDEIQFQPSVTIQMTAQANPKIVTLTGGDAAPPSITLTTTVSTRNYDEIKSPCGL